MGFVLDPRLEDTSLFVEDWALCHVRLKNDTRWPWLYLVPRRPEVREIFHLPLAEQTDLIREIARAGRLLDRLHAPKKINTAALGNIVPQLHVHVFARFEHDPGWPGSVWAVQGPEIPYTETAGRAAIDALRHESAAQQARDNGDTA